MESALDLSSKSPKNFQNLEGKDLTSPVLDNSSSNCCSTKENETAIFKNHSDRTRSEQVPRKELNNQKCNESPQNTYNDDSRFQEIHQQIPDESQKYSPLHSTTQCSPLPSFKSSCLPDRSFTMYPMNQTGHVSGIFPFPPTSTNPAVALGAVMGMFPFGMYGGRTDYSQQEDIEISNVSKKSLVDSILPINRKVKNGYSTSNDYSSSTNKDYAVPESQQFQTSIINKSSTPPPPQDIEHHNQDMDINNTLYDRRRKNNEAAKRSRDARRMKEEEIALRAALLEQENLKLKAQVAVLKNETSQLHCMLYQL